MSSSILTSTLPRGLFLAGAVALAPVIIAKGGVHTNDACAEDVTGTCCHEVDSICNAGGTDHVNYYYKSSGSCQS